MAPRKASGTEVKDTATGTRVSSRIARQNQLKAISISQTVIETPSTAQAGPSKVKAKATTPKSNSSSTTRKKTASTRAIRPARPTPTPMPIDAPVERPPLLELALFVAVGLAEGVCYDVSYERVLAG